VYDLPAGATPVDFAYAVHTELGRYITGAKVDGKIVPLDYKLKSGEVVEILKSKNPKTPNPHWLDFVVTTQARREINRYLRSEGVKE
jgi:GTP pyrophosphokinase